MNRTVIATWVTRLERLTNGLVLPTDRDEIERYTQAFSDGCGDRRGLDAPLLARLMGGDARHFMPQTEDDKSTALMRAAGRRDVDAVMTLIGDEEDDEPRPLIAQPSIATLEAETEGELAAVHAVGALALTFTPQLLPRVEQAARWLMAEIQPDNATHRPWAVHVFVWAAATMDGDMAIDAEMYAQTLVHNAAVASSMTSGKIDVFSLVLLLDAQRTLASVT